MAASRARGPAPGLPHVLPSCLGRPTTSGCEHTRTGAVVGCTHGDPRSTRERRRGRRPRPGRDAAQLRRSCRGRGARRPEDHPQRGRHRPLRHVRHGPGQRAGRRPAAQQPAHRQGRRLHVELPAVAGPRDHGAGRLGLPLQEPHRLPAGRRAAGHRHRSRHRLPRPQGQPDGRRGLARARGGPHRPRGRGALPDHDGPQQPRDRRAHRRCRSTRSSPTSAPATARSTWTAGRGPCCGGWPTGCAPTGCASPARPPRTTPGSAPRRSGSANRPRRPGRRTISR